MRAPVRSAYVLVRDLAALTAVAVAGGTAVAAACLDVARHDLAAHPGPGGLAVDLPFSWADALRSGSGWAWGVAVWLAVAWCATRARASRRTVGLPLALAATLLALRAALALWDGLPWASYDLWPGPVEPYHVPTGDGGLRPSLAHPAWGFPLLFLALLVAAALLGARAGCRPDDAASRSVHLLPGRAVAMAGLVVGLPAAFGAAGAAVARYASRPPDGLDWSAPWAQVVRDVGLPLVAALLAGALLSGTGPLGMLLTATVTLLVAEPPVLSWMIELNGAVPLGVPAGMVVACVAVALWRPAADWAVVTLAPLDAPAALDPRIG